MNAPDRPLAVSYADVASAAERLAGHAHRTPRMTSHTVDERTGAVAASHPAPDCKVIGVEPEAGDDATRSFKTKTLQSCHNPDTIADGARTHSLGRLTFPLVLRYVSDMVTVSDAELVEAVLYLWERMKIIVEPTGALGAAGLFERGLPVAAKRVGVILSGGNVDLKLMAKYF